MSQPYRSVAAERRPDPAESFHISVAADDFMQMEAGFALLSAGSKEKALDWFSVKWRRGVLR